MGFPHGGNIIEVIAFICIEEHFLTINSAAPTYRRPRPSRSAFMACEISHSAVNTVSTPADKFPALWAILPLWPNGCEFLRDSHLFFVEQRLGIDDHVPHIASAQPLESCE